MAVTQERDAFCRLASPRAAAGSARRRVCAAIAAIALIPVGARADTSADEVLAAARAVSAPIRDKSMRVRMSIIEPDGEERVRLLRGYEKKTENGRRILWLFDSPSELQGTSFLAWQEGKEPDHLWVYFPGQRRVRQVPPQLRRENFQGSAFTFEDLTAVFYLDYTGESQLEGEQPCDGARCQLVLTKLPEGQFAYRQMRSWIRADDHIPVRVEFFDDSLLKVLRVLRTEQIEGVPTVVEMEMESPRDAYRTRVVFSDVDYNKDLDESIFTVGNLQQTGK
jgi:outer membrane lipoprotein-sorting protein